MKRPVVRRRFRPFALASIAALLLVLFALPAAARDYRRYMIGDPAAPTPGRVEPGLLLMGGGDRNFDALR